MNEYISHVYFKSLVFGTEALEIKFISDYQARGLLLQMLLIKVVAYFLILNVLC